MKQMVFIIIPKGKFPKTRKQIANDSGKKGVTNMKMDIMYADEDSRIVFTDLDVLKAWCKLKKVIPLFVEAGM